MPAPIGHNSNPLTPAERQANFMHHLGLINRQHARVEAEQAIEKTLRKEAKIDGNLLADIDFGLRAMKAEDDRLIPAEILRHNDIARWIGLPVGTQAEFNFKKDTSLAAARREGQRAGYLAAKREPPYEAGTPEEQEWLKAYDGAQAQARDDLLSSMQKLSDARLAASRRGKNGDAPDEDEDDQDDA